MHSKGFIKALILAVVLVGFLVVFFTKFAQYFKPSGIADQSGYSPEATGPVTNPLIDFENANDVYKGTYGGGTDAPSGGASSYSGKVTLSSGNSSSAIQPFEEYVIIRNGSGAPVTITGWTLTNGRGTRPIETSGNNYVYPVADSATIGQGTEYLSPEGSYNAHPITLEQGDMAYVITGGPFIQYRMPINTSFRENICLGYLAKDYPWAPQVSLSCPMASQDPAISSVTRECYDYVRTLSRCEDPERTDEDNFDLQRSQCKDFIRERFTYAGCVTQNEDNANFLTNRWRVFLGKGRELWSRDAETITLYDASGRIVDQIKY